MHVIADMLEVTQDYGIEGIKPTVLLSKANLSHGRMIKFIETLTGAGLMNKIEYDGRHTFVITPKGKQYLESYQKFHEIANSFGLEL